MPALLELRSVMVPGRGRPRLEADLAVAPGVTAVLGASAAGKTTLLDLLAGYLQPASGEVVWEPPGDSGARLRAFWSPAAGGLWPHRTVREHLELVAPEGSRIDRLLADFDLQGEAAVLPGELSLGQQSRLGVARALASGARVLLLDEPLAHVAPAAAEGCWAALMGAIRETESALVFATHEPARVLAHADRVVCLDRGRVVYQGPVRELYATPESETLAAFLGPANWIPDAERSAWTDLPAPACVRPEQLQVVRDDRSPLLVRRSAHGGSVSSTAILDERVGRERVFHHVTPATALQPGLRVALRLCLSWLCALLLSGCVTKDDDQAMRASRYRSLPPLGARLPAPRGVSALPGGRALVLDNAGRVILFGADLAVEREWKMPEYDVGRPEGGCLLRDGRFAVADTHYSRVVFFHPDGTVSSTMGSRGTGPGQFLFPIKVTQDPAGNLYVAEYGSNDRVQKFTEQGGWLLSFGSFGGGPRQFQRPSGLVWREGKVYVADAVHNRIQVFTDRGDHVATLGGPGTGLTLRMPYDLSAGPDGDLYACEYGAGRVTRFTTGGRLVGRFGKVGRGDGEMVTPWGLAALDDGRVVVADTGNRRLVEWRR